MSFQDFLKAAGDTLAILPKLYEDVAQPSVQKVGKALGTVFGLSVTAVLPIRMANEKSLIRYKKHMEGYRKKLDAISEEDICEVPPEIGVPIMETLTYTTNEDIADLFTTLLATASSSKTVHRAHPSFVGQVKRLSADESKIIRYLKTVDFVPYLILQITHENGKSEVRDRMTDLENLVDLDFKGNVNLYLENLQSMGVLYTDRTTYKSDRGIYIPLEERYKPLFDAYSKEAEKYNGKPHWAFGFYLITNYGWTFIDACTMKFPGAAVDEERN